MINFDDVTKEYVKEHNIIWLQIPDPPIQKIDSWRFLISHQPDINKIYLYAENLYKGKYQLFINKQENTGLKHFNYSKAFIQYSNHMDNIYKNIEEYCPNKERKIMILREDVIADILSYKNLIQQLLNYSLGVENYVFLLLL